MKKSLTAFLLAASVVLGARAADLPAINTPATTDYFPGKFIWADLFTSDQQAASQFYTGLFGWTATTIDRTSPERGPLSYIVLSNEGRPIAGIAVGPKKATSDVRGHWMGFISVADVQTALDLAVANGGKVLSETKDLHQRGTQAMLYDNQGAMVGILHSSSGDPGEYRPDPGDFTWAEVFARDTTQASQFYRNVIGYDVTPDYRADRQGTFLFTSGGYARASLAPLPPMQPKARPAWLLFVRVANIQDTISKVTQLGGRVLVAPMEVHGTSSIAIIADNVGAAIGIVQHDEAQPPATTEAPATMPGTGSTPAGPSQMPPKP